MEELYKPGASQLDIAFPNLILINNTPQYQYYYVSRAFLSVVLQVKVSTS